MKEKSKKAKMQKFGIMKIVFSLKRGASFWKWRTWRESMKSQGKGDNQKHAPHWSESITFEKSKVVFHTLRHFLKVKTQVLEAVFASR